MAVTQEVLGDGCALSRSWLRKLHGVGMEAEKERVHCVRSRPGICRCEQEDITFQPQVQIADVCCGWAQSAMPVTFTTELSPALSLMGQACSASAPHCRLEA